MSSFVQIRLSFFICMLLIHTYYSYNSYRKETGPNGEDIWRSTSDFVPVQSQSYGTIKLGHRMSTEFDFSFVGRTNYPRAWSYENFFRVGYDATQGINCFGQGARYPSFWLSHDDDTMHVSTSSGQICQPTQSLQEYGQINTSQIYHVYIAFNNTQLVVQISGGNKPKWSKFWKREATPKQHIGNIVPIWWMSNKHSSTPYNVGNGIFSNIVIKSSIFTSSEHLEPNSTSSVRVLSTDIITTTYSPSIAITTGVRIVDINEDDRDMLYIHRYIGNKMNIILSAVTFATCLIGICLLRIGLRNKKKVKRNLGMCLNKYERTRANSLHSEGRQRMDTLNLNIGEEGEEDDLPNVEIDTDDDDIVKEVNETAFYIHDVIHNDIDGDLMTQPAMDVYPACIVIMDKAPFCE